MRSAEEAGAPPPERPGTSYPPPRRAGAGAPAPRWVKREGGALIEDAADEPFEVAFYVRES